MVITTPTFQALNMPLYEGFKVFYSEMLQQERASWAVSTAASMSAAIICMTITNPMWLVATRMQAEVFRL